MVTVLDLLIELQKSVIILTIGRVDLGKGFTQDLMHIVKREQGGLS